MEYFVIGEREIVLGFMLAGVKGQAVNSKTEAQDAFRRLTSSVSVGSDRPKILILTEDVSDMLEDEIKSHQMRGIAPLIVEIPCLSGHIQGHKTLTESIREAVGIQV